MVYVIAAYSITVGVLALYAVSLQHRMRVYGGAAAVERSGEDSTDLYRGFNVGAALLTPFWMWAHGLRLTGALIGLLWVAIGPLVQRELWIPLLFVASIPLAAGLALGLVGNRIAVGHLSLESLSARSASQLPWAFGGIVLHVFVLPWLFYWLLR